METIAIAAVLVSACLMFSFKHAPGGRFALLAFLISSTALAAVLLPEAVGTLDHVVVFGVLLLVGFVAGRNFTSIAGGSRREAEEAQAIVDGISHHFGEGKDLDVAIELSLRELELRKLRSLQVEALDRIDAGEVPHQALMRVAEGTRNVVWHQITVAVAEAVDELGVIEDHDEF